MQVIHIHPQAPHKPALGQPCNGCGVCCLAEPCPLGVLLSRKRSGGCRAVVWDEAHERYQCGALQRWNTRAASRPAGRLVAWLMERLVRRWIAADRGCDATLEVDARQR